MRSDCSPASHCMLCLTRAKKPAFEPGFALPIDIKPRILTTAINEDDNTRSLALAMDVAGYFDLDETTAKKVAAEVGKTVSRWRDEAGRHGISKTEVDRMASAFEHDDLKMAVGA